MVDWWCCVGNWLRLRLERCNGLGLGGPWRERGGDGLGLRSCCLSGQELWRGGVVGMAGRAGLGGACVGESVVSCEYYR